MSTPPLKEIKPLPEAQRRAILKFVRSLDKCTTRCCPACFSCRARITNAALRLAYAYVLLAKK